MSWMTSMLFFTGLGGNALVHVISGKLNVMLHSLTTNDMILYSVTKTEQITVRNMMPRVSNTFENQLQK